jgi:pimeloyl-ACP methyl ester carboxylesterase
MTDVLIDRAFARISEGLIHYRECPAIDAGATPLVLIHASPTSSRTLESLMRQLRNHGARQRLIAPDTLGNGDSAAPALETPEIAYFAESVLRTLDALKIAKADFYGTHTGARIAAEIAVIAPARVGRVVLDGITDYDDAFKADILANFAPDIRADEYGRHLVWAFNFVRDQAFHFPYFKRDADHRVSKPLPSPSDLHEKVLEVLKALATYHKSYLAAFRYTPRVRLPLISAPTLFLAADTETAMLQAAATEMAKLVPSSTVAATKGGDSGKAQAICAYLAA